MAWLERVQAGGRGLERRLDLVSAEALLAGLRAAGAVTEPEVAALGRPGSSGWVRRLCALAVAKGDQTCRVLLTVLEGLEGPPRPGPFDFYDPQRDAAPTHRSDCPCCQPEPQGAGEEEEEGEPRNGEEGPKEEEGEAQNGEEGPGDDKGGGDEAPEGEGDEGPEEDEGPKDNEGGGEEGTEDDEGGGVEGPEDDEDGGDEDLEEDEGGGDEGPEEDEGGGDED
ncbi:S-antigen protein-like [Parus major]|uniref:S-antigen protein-like n=1 Tax=Parus major TaxID=9157 RepID=UPI0008F47885|nr:S-antigen protein-like [Parus major]